MEDVVRPFPVRKGDLDDLASVPGDELAELADALRVGPVAVADGDGLFVEPGDVAAFESARVADLSEDRPAGLGAEPPGRPRLAPPELLAHPGKDDAARRDAGRVADVDRVEARRRVGRQEMDLGHGSPEDLHEPVVLVAGPAEIGLGRIAQGPPLLPHVLPAAPSLAGMLEKEAPDRGDFGGAGEFHKRILAAPGTNVKHPQLSANK